MGPESTDSGPIARPTVVPHLSERYFTIPFMRDLVCTTTPRLTAKLRHRTDERCHGLVWLCGSATLVFSQPREQR